MSSLPLASAILLALVPSTSAALQSTALAASPPEPQPLNVMLIVIDDVGMDLIGAFSREYACRECAPGVVPDPCTPNLDALAAQGMRFTNVWSSPWCTPTRAQIMTGKQVRHLGTGVVTNPNKNRRGMDPDEVTIADLVPFASAVGKWHLAEASQGWEHPLQSGFETFAGTLWNLNPWPEDGPTYLNWRRYDGISPPVRTYEYATKVTTDDALTQLATLNTVSSPWLMYVSYSAIHVPFHCPPNPPTPGSTPCTQDWWGRLRRQLQLDHRHLPRLRHGAGPGLRDRPPAPGSRPRDHGGDPRGRQRDARARQEPALRQGLQGDDVPGRDQRADDRARAGHDPR